MDAKIFGVCSDQTDTLLPADVTPAEGRRKVRAGAIAMSQCVVEPGLDFESSLFAQALLDELRRSLPRTPRHDTTARHTRTIAPPPPRVIVDEEYERWDGLG
jgi:hypothetical protein